MGLSIGSIARSIIAYIINEPLKKRPDWDATKWAKGQEGAAILTKIGLNFSRPTQMQRVNLGFGSRQ
ncbi:hypothetical protein RB2150_16954 [Rhodobacterales bacterium HTCC2150]|nr:hypothetical protein RB2150_16954 [Rhodobacterales bacterium HTCC2150] [Rhodobacteraceae bacterium HTCC2150]